MQTVSDFFLSGRAVGGGSRQDRAVPRPQAAAAESEHHATREEYLASLGLTVELRRDPRDAIGARLPS